MLHFTNFNYVISWAAALWCINFGERAGVCVWVNAHLWTWTKPELHQLAHKFNVSRAEITHYRLFNKCMAIHPEPGWFFFSYVNDCWPFGYKLKLITVNGVQMLFCANMIKWVNAHVQSTEQSCKTLQRPNWKCLSGQKPGKVSNTRTSS